MTNRTIAIVGAGVGAIGLAYEFFLSPSAKASIAAAKAAGQPLGPLGARPLSSVGHSPIIPAKAPAATRFTTGNPSPGAARSTTSQPLTLGNALPGLISGFGSLLSKLGGSSSSDKKPQPGGGSGGGSSLGGAPSSGGAGKGKQAPTGLPNDWAPSNLGAGGAAYAQASETYADQYGQVAYLQPNGTYQDEWGNEVYLDNEGTVQYGSGSDYWAQNDGGVGFVAGGEVFPDSSDGSEATADPVADAGDLGGEQLYDGSYDAWDDPESSEFYGYDGSGFGGGNDFLSGDDYGSGFSDGGFIEPTFDSGSLSEGDSFSDYGFSDWDGGGGDGSYEADNMAFDDW